jgi:hypothetical protein
MAADLASDLREAEADGVSAEEILGSSAFDPRSFAASWAAERGIIPEPPSRGNNRRRPLVLVAFTVIAAIALIGAALLLLTGEPKVSVVASGAPRAHFPSARVMPFGPPGPGRQVVLPPASTSGPAEWMLLFFALVALGFGLAVVEVSRSQPPPPRPSPSSRPSG